MSTAINGIFAIAEETQFGVEAASGYVSNEIESESLTADTAVIYPALLNGTRSISYALPGLYSGSGSVSAPAHPEGILPRLVKGLLGQVETTDLGCGAYSHAFTLKQDSTPLSFTTYVDHLAGKKLWVGSVVSGLSISGGLKRDLRVSWGMNAQHDAETTEKSYSRFTARPFVWSDAAVTLNGTTAPNVENMNVRMNNSVEAVFSNNGSRHPQKFVLKDFVADGAFTLEFEDMTQQRRFWGAVDATEPENAVLENTLSILYSSPEQISTSGVYYQLQIDFNAIIYTRGQPTLSGQSDRVTQNFAFRAIRGSGHEIVQVTIVNGESIV